MYANIGTADCCSESRWVFYCVVYTTKPGPGPANVVAKDKVSKATPSTAGTSNQIPANQSKAQTSGTFASLVTNAPNPTPDVPVA